MIQKRKKSLRLKHLFIVIAASVLVLLIGAYAITNAVIGAIEASKPEDEKAKPQIDESLGEAIYGDFAVAYPYFDNDKIQSVDVSYKEEDISSPNGVVKRHFTAKRPSAESEFIFYYTDSDNNAQMYMPDISKTAGFDYTDLYAVTGTGAYKNYKITYFLFAVSVLYFDERIPMSTDPTAKAAQLDRYGLSPEDRQTITVTYLDKEGAEHSHTIHIGNLTIDGTGYYYTVDDRQVIYNSTDKNFDYALNGFVSFLHSRLTAEGQDGDAALEPYLTQKYKQWKNTIHNDEKDTSDLIVTDAKVVLSGSEEEYLYEDINHYEKTGLNSFTGKITFVLDSTAPSQIKNVLVGKPVGDLSAINVTIPGDTNWASIGNAYDYTIKSIDAVLTDGADITAPGTPVGDARYIKVTYDYTWENRDSSGFTHPQSYTDAKAVIDLQKVNTGIPQSVIDGLKAASVGTVDPASDAGRKFTISYTEQTADQYKIDYVITEIKMIYTVADGGLSVVDKVAEDSVVNIGYALKSGTTVIESGTTTVNLGEITDTNNINYKIKTALIDQGVGEGLDIVAYSDTLFREYFADYRTYTLDRVEYFVTEELISAFKFVNKSDRNPFYGESLFINDLDNQNKVYALDSTASEYVVRILYGVSLDSSSTTSEGLVGSKTVAVGLSADNMLKYGLYANTIYFEMPRGIGYGAEDGDYTVLNTIPFTLYISDLQPDGSRYVGSDMYDIIAQVDGAAFVFLDKSFVDYWARDSVAAVTYEKIDKLTLDFNMSDLKGSYTLDVHHKEMWIIGEEMTPIKPETGGQRFDQISIEVLLNGMDGVNAATDSLLKTELLKRGNSSIMLNSIYAITSGIENPQFFRNGYDAVNFQSALDIIYHTYYTGMFDPVSVSDEQASIIQKGDRLMSFSFTIEDKNFPDTYYYDFYRADDRRVMVSIYKHGEKANAVSDFYISTFAFKKIAGGFVDLFNGVEVNGDESYKH